MRRQELFYFFFHLSLIVEIVEFLEDFHCFCPVRSPMWIKSKGDSWGCCDPWETFYGAVREGSSGRDFSSCETTASGGFGFFEGYNALSHLEEAFCRGYLEYFHVVFDYNSSIGHVERKSSFFLPNFWDFSYPM